MDDIVNRFAHELAQAIAEAIAGNPQVETCREKARAAGFEMRLSLEAVVHFVHRPPATTSTALMKVPPAEHAEPRMPGSPDITANDRRFLRSLRIAADETAK